MYRKLSPMPNEMVVIQLPLSMDEETVSQLDRQSRICNWAYNHLLDQALCLKREYIQTQNSECAKTVYTERGLRNLLPSLKKEHPFLRLVHSSPLKNTALRLSQAIRTHQKSKKTTRRTGWPKFRSWKRQWFSLYYDEPNKGFKIEKDTLILSLGTGQDRVRRSLQLKIKNAHLLHSKEIRTLRITKKHGQYSLICTVQRAVPAPKPIQTMIALDPNHKNLCYGVDTQGKAVEIATPFWLKSYDRRLDELKRKRDRCQRKAHQKEVCDEKNQPVGTTYWEPSRRWKKYARVLEKALYKRREQTKTFVYTVAHSLCKRYDCVGIGNYTPHGNGCTRKMRRAMNNRSTIGRLKETLAWVCKKSGKTYFEYNEEGTTRTCSCCGSRVEDGIPLHIRAWQCPQCQSQHIRDENAAQNGLMRVVQHVQQKDEQKCSLVSCSDLAPIMERWAWRVLPSGVLCTLRGQNCGLIATPPRN